MDSSYEAAVLACFLPQRIRQTQHLRSRYKHTSRVRAVASKIKQTRLTWSNGLDLVKKSPKCGSVS